MFDEMNDSMFFGQLGLFGDDIGPILGEKKTKKTEKKVSITDKKKEQYRGPLKIVFDSIDSVDILEDKEFSKEEILEEVSKSTGFTLFQENAKEFTLNRLKEGMYLLRAGYNSRYEKGSAGKKLLLQQLHILENIVQTDRLDEINVDDVKKYIQDNYGIDVDLHLIGDTYIPEPCIKKICCISKLEFPVKLTALTLFGEHLELEKGDYESLATNLTDSQNKAEESEEPEEPEESEEPEQSEELEEPEEPEQPEEPEELGKPEESGELAETRKKGEGKKEISESILKELIKMLFPEYAEDLQYTYIEEKSLIQVVHRSLGSIKEYQKPSIKKEDTYPTNAVVSLIFTRIELSSEMFNGKEEITKKELLKYIGKQYPEYSPERTEITYDKKKNLIIPLLKSGKRGGNYLLEDTDEYRKEETALMSINVVKEVPDIYGCVRGTVYFNLPKIPFSVLRYIIHFFWEIYVCEGTEAIAQIFYKTDSRTYEVYIPRQTASSGSVEFERDPQRELDESSILVMEIHSHGKFRAHWSDIDNREEVAHKLYAVVGNIPSFRYDKEHIRIRAATGGFFVQMEIEDVFEFKKL